MDKNNLITILGKDIESIDQHLKTLNQNISVLSEKLGSLKKTHSLLKKEEEDMAREIIKENNTVIQLKNGQVNVPYQETLPFEEFIIPSNTTLYFEGIDQIRWNQEESKFEGDLSTPGEFYGKLSFWNNITDKEAGKPKRERQVHILINADPKSLWKNIQPPAEGPFFKENTSFSFEKANNKTLLGASIRGKSHAQKGTFRDDDFQINSWENGWVLQVVSDGAGSAEYSREGSKIACKSVLEKVSKFINGDKLEHLEKIIQEIESSTTLKDNATTNDINSIKIDHIETPNENLEQVIDSETIPETPDIEQEDVSITEENSIKKELSTLVNELTVKPAHYAFQEIRKFAEENKYPIKMFSSTILFALSKEFDFGTVVISFSIGDGAIGIVTEKEGVLLMEPDGGEFSGQTRFVTMKEVFHSQDIYKRSNLRLFKDKVEAIILMSDGISDPKFGTDNNLKDSDIWLSFWNDLKPVVTKEDLNEKEILDWMDFHEKGEYDDRTLTILF